MRDYKLYVESQQLPEKLPTQNAQLPPPPKSIVIITVYK